MGLELWGQAVEPKEPGDQEALELCAPAVEPKELLVLKVEPGELQSNQALELPMLRNYASIPSLVLLDSEANGRETITTSGRSFVMENCVEDFPRSWAPKPYADLTKTAECKGSSINDEKALCVFVHQMEDKNVDGLKALASKNEKADTLFFYATEDSGIAEQVVRLCDIKPPKGEATLVLLDLDDDGAYYLTN